MARFILGIVCVVALGAFHATPAAAQRLTVAYLGPESDAAFRKVLLPWARAVRAETKGATNPELMPDGLLGRDPGQQAALVDQGVADMAWVRTDAHTKRFPDDGVLRLPGLVRSPRDGAPAAWSLQSQGLLRGYDKYKVIAYVAGPSAQLVTAKPYTTMRQVRLGRWLIGGSSAEARLGIASLGARPEQVPQDRIGFALTEQVVTGALAEPREVLKADPRALYKEVVRVPAGASGFALIMNAKKFEALPEASRKALMKHGGLAFARRYGAVMAEDETAAIAELTQNGRRKLIEMSDKDRAEWEKASAKAQRTWAAKHPNGRALLAALRQALAAR